MATEEPLDRLLHKATAAKNSSPDWPAIKMFADKVAESDDGFQSALRLLVHRIQSSDEQEALNGLLVLNCCVDTCGPDFQEEIGKFRFLNELIKLVSPKYLGNHTAPKVKTKVIELLFNWAENLKDQTKIKVAYEMLKKQKVVTKDPVPESVPPPNPIPPRPKNVLFEDEEKSKLLQKLLHSTNREDVQAANRLIKSMVKEDERRVERAALRFSEIETIINTVKVLTEMLANYQSGSTSADDVDVIKEIYQTCERLQPNIFRSASETDDKDEHLGEILKANDELTKVIEYYKSIFGPNLSTSNESATSNIATVTSTSVLPNIQPNPPDKQVDISLLDLDSQSDDAAVSVANSLDDQMLLLDDAIFNASKVNPSQIETKNENDKKRSDIEELGLVFDKYQAVSAPSFYDFNSQNILKPTKSEIASDFSGLNVSNGTETILVDTKSQPAKSSKGLEDLDCIGISLLKQALPPNASLGTEFNKPPERLTMNQMRNANLNQPPLNSKPFTMPQESLLSSLSNNEVTDVSLLFVPLETIKPANVAPLTLYDKNGLNVVLHFSKERPKPDVTVIVVTSINKSIDPITSLLITFEAKENIKLTMQPPSSTQLPGFNPIFPLSPVTQIMLIASKSVKINLSYRLTYKMQEKMHVEGGEIEFNTEF